MKELSYLEFSRKIYEQSLSGGAFIKAQYEITFACNLHCVHCYTDPYNTPEMKAKELPYEEVIKILDKLHAENVLWLSFTGGEIFMRKDFLKIYDYAFAKGFVITLFTNATLITEAVADHLAQNPPFYLDVTIYGATQETYEKVTQVPGSFKRFQEGMERLTSRGLRMKLKTSLLTLNYQETNEMKAFAETRGIPFRTSALVYPRLNGDLSSLQYRLSVSEILKLTFDAQDLEASCNQSSSFTEEAEEIASKPSPSLYRCGCGKVNAQIDPSGTIGTCTWARQNRFDTRQFGVQKAMQSLARIVDAQYYSSDSACATCTAVPFCSKNPEMAVYETGNAQLPVKHFCDVAYGTKKIMDSTQNSGDIK